MTTRWLDPVLAATVVGVLLQAAPARADAIDGNWCSAEGRHMSIEGPAIVTPAGTATVGDYRRHSFSYVVPASEAGAGETVLMILRNENTVNLAQAADAASAAKAPMQVWHRCPPSVS